MSKHTPAPWHASTFRLTGVSAGIDIGASDNSNIALVHHQASDREPMETKANARLIAAAPELYELLKTARALAKECADELSASGMSPLWVFIHKADDLIAKVEGE